MRELLDRNDIPPYYLPVKNRFIYYFPNILHYGVNAENEYNDLLKNLPLYNMCGNLAANSYFLKLALNIFRDYIDSIHKAGDRDRDIESCFEHDKNQIEEIIKIIETYFSYLIDPDSKIKRVETGGETDGESEECDSDSDSDSDRTQGTKQYLNIY